MNRRLLKGATGNLYDRQSDACHFALQQLRDVLIDIGFKVHKKTSSEATLRVYPGSGRKYPLLNPRFESGAADFDESIDVERVECSVWSRDDDGSLDQHLRQFISTDACRFVPVEGHPGGLYYRHGYFVLPISFSGSRGDHEIDFQLLVPQQYLKRGS